MMQKHLTDKVAEGGGQFLAEKLPDSFVCKTLKGFTCMLSGALEVHRLAVKDKLKGREEDLTEDIINATCTFGYFKEVSESPRSLSSPGHATVARLLARVLGVGGAAAEQRRRPQPARDMQHEWIPNNSDLAGG